jgi:hypothetical protein
VNFVRTFAACAPAVMLSACTFSNAAPSAGYSKAESDARAFQSERRWGADASKWEPVVAADPASHWIYQMTTEQRPDFLLFRASPDGGATWLPARHICRRGTRIPFQYDPQVTVTADGTVDAVCLNGFRPGVVFTQSRDRGRRWSASIRLDGALRYSDKPTLAVSANGSDVYVAFNARYALYVAASHDGGTTWQPPVRATSAHLWYYSYGGTVAPDGSVWFAVDGEAGRSQTRGGAIAVVSSHDGGVTWQVVDLARTHEGAPCRVHNCYPDFYTGQAAIAVDRAGRYVVAFTANGHRGAPNSLYASRSSDGLRWSSPSPVATAGNSTSPAIVAGPRAGDFRLVWQDDRNGRHAWNTWFARSTNAGATWSAAVRLSDRGGGAAYKNPNGYAFPFGDYLGLAVDASGTDYVIWGEGAAVYHPGGTWWARD